MATVVRREAGRESGGGVSGDGVRPRRGATAPGGGAGELDLRRGGELQRGRRRRNLAAAARGGGEWRARTREGGNFSPLGIRARPKSYRALQPTPHIWCSG
jgi:hypothetical protein